MEQKSKNISVTEVVAAGTAITFVLSIFYEKGYFSVLNKDFFDLLTISDFIASPVYWLPWLLIPMFMGMLLWTLASRADGWAPNQKKSSKGNTRIKRFKFWFDEWGLLFQFSVIGFIYPLFYDSSAYFCFVMVSAIWIIGFIVPWIVKHENCPYSFKAVYISAVSIIFLALSFTTGMKDARQTLLRKSEVYFSDGTSENYIFVRKLENGVILKTETEPYEVLYVRNELMKKISFTAKPITIRSGLCAWFNVMCRDTK